MNHLIARQLFELKTGSSRNAFRLQHELSGLFWRAVAPELERIFDRLAPPDSLIRIDKLEIDLGQLSEEDLLDGKFLPHLSRLLEEAVSKAIREQRRGIQRLSLTEGHFEQWLRFLENGFLLWDGRRPEQDWLKGVKDWLAQSGPAVERLHRLAKHNRQAFQRLVLQHSPEFLVAIAELFTGHKQSVLAEASREWQKLPDLSPALLAAIPIAGARRRELLFWERVIWMAIIRRQKISAAQLVERTMADLVAPLRWPAVSQALKEQPEGFDQLTATFEILGKRQSRLSQKEEGQAKKRKAKGPEAGPEKQFEEKAELPDATEAPKEHSKSQPPVVEKGAEPADEVSGPEWGEQAWQLEEGAGPPVEPLPEGTEIFIPNAGIILLHSFLVRFFDVLELLEGSDFQSEETRQKAIHLLHFLATGEESMPEYQLVLPKFLCGMPLNLPLSHQAQFSEEEKEECEGLLEAVIRNWGALGDVSIDSLREGFLQRQGKLSKRDTGWLLQVEQQTLDILLDKLPWGIGIVKLPWMEELLRVEWR